MLEPTCFIVRIDLAKHVFYAIVCSSLLFTFCGQKVTKTSGSTYVFRVRSRFYVSLMVVSQSINFGRHDHASQLASLRSLGQLTQCTHSAPSVLRLRLPNEPEPIKNDGKRKRKKHGSRQSKKVKTDRTIPLFSLLLMREMARLVRDGGRECIGGVCGSRCACRGNGLSLSRFHRQLPRQREP